MIGAAEGEPASMAESHVNRRAAEQIQQAIAEFRRKTLTKGFFGRYAIDVKVEDGTIREVSYTTEERKRA